MRYQFSASYGVKSIPALDSSFRNVYGVLASYASAGVHNMTVAHIICSGRRLSFDNSRAHSAYDCTVPSVHVSLYHYWRVRVRRAVVQRHTSMFVLTAVRSSDHCQVGAELRKRYQAPW